LPDYDWQIGTIRFRRDQTRPEQDPDDDSKESQPQFPGSGFSLEDDDDEKTQDEPEQKS
jgi:hypothetical protein